MSFSSGAAGVVTGPVKDVVGSVVGLGLSSVFAAAGQWVASGAVWLLAQVGGAMSASTAIDLSSGWFLTHESVMVAISAALVLPMVLCATLQALYRQSASMLIRTFLVQLPLALLLTGVAVELVQMALAVTDSLSAEVLNSAGVDSTHILAPVSTFLIGANTVTSEVPAFVVFVGGLLVALAALGLWLELVVRAAAVSVAVLFLPLALAAMVWPAVSHWCRRLTDTLVALILSKLVIATVLSLAIGALAGGLGVGATGGDGGGFAAVVTGIALLIIATMSPFTLLKLIPALEAGAVSHLEGRRNRVSSVGHGPLEAGRHVSAIVQGAKPSGLPSGAASAAVGTTPVSSPLGTGVEQPEEVAKKFYRIADASGVSSASSAPSGPAGTAAQSDRSSTVPAPESAEERARVPDPTETSRSRPDRSDANG
ncbi:MAG TPA: hypothetical protein VIJ09_02800 [Acidimicrobiales bacterium]